MFQDTSHSLSLGIDIKIRPAYKSQRVGRGAVKSHLLRKHRETRNSKQMCVLGTGTGTGTGTGSMEAEHS